MMGSATRSGTGDGVGASGSCAQGTVVFATEPYEYLAEDILALGDVPGTSGAYVRGALERHTFPDGERYLRLTEPVLARHVVLVGGTITDAATLELYDLASAIVKDGARSLTMIVPYYGYSTMERAVNPGEVVTAKTRARLLSSIPSADAPNRIFLFDTHTEGLAYYFEGPIEPVHVYAKQVVIELAHELGGPVDNLVLACTDAGRAKWVESLANDMGVPASFVFKRRLDGSRTEVRAVSAQVEGKSVVIYDDMIRTGSSLLGAARAYLEAGARRVTAVATHGIFPGDSLDKLKAAGVIERIACTDSHPRARALAGDYLQVTSSARLFHDRLVAARV